MRLAALICAAGCALLAALPGRAAEEPAGRVEARSDTLLVVGIAHADRLVIHVSRVADNAPVRDAVVSVALRGAVHPTIAEADGSYTLQTKDLTLPGPASLEFRVVQGAESHDLKGMLSAVDAGAKSDDRNGARQIWWWVLNFAVCIGFLMLISRRRKAARRD